MLKVSLMLTLFAIGFTALVAITEESTRDKISENERQTLLKAINALVDKKQYNNDILLDTMILAPTAELGTHEESTVFRARKDGDNVAAIFTSIAPDGYSGKIKLLVGVYMDGSLAGVRVISHKETPGLGDKINEKKADWILQFKGLSLTKPTESNWKVKKDGGQFDQFTGATITPRAVVSAVRGSLHYFALHRDELFIPVTNQNAD
ncbi:MAG: electron transport complex subunit RsxG [Gammaproteobacteria bacterium]|nr:MAG: electron transport complex subunit RsxG [Gammaproteobacteria bacterium]